MSLRLVHTSDWHLGKKLMGVSRLHEQIKFLNWLSSYIREEKIDLLLVSGDIFDAPSPPHDALKTYYQFLDIATKENPELEIVILSGNHDSGRFLQAPSVFLNERRITVIGEMLNEAQDAFNLLNYEINGVKLSITALPFFRTYEIDKLVNNENDSTDYIKTLKENFKSKDHFHILMAHHLFGNYETTGSELGISLSGVESIPTKGMDSFFDYLALGHIHKWQTLSESKPCAIYCGSPIPFRFSEHNKKHISILEIESKDVWSFNKTEIPKFCELIKLDVTNENMTSELEKLVPNCTEDYPYYLELRVSLDTAVSGLSDKAKEIIKDSNINLISFYTHLSRDKEKENHTDIFSFDNTQDLFKHFYSVKFPESSSVTTEIFEEFNNLLSEVSSTKDQDEDS